MALHQPGHPDVHRVFGDPPGAGGALLPDAVPDVRRAGNVRAAGNVPTLDSGIEVKESKAEF